MAKDPYKDPFPGLRPPRLFAAAETACHKALREIAELPGSPVTCLSPFGLVTKMDVTKISKVTKIQARVTKKKAGRPAKVGALSPAERKRRSRAAKDRDEAPSS